jgi:hypothetical protein
MPTRTRKVVKQIHAHPNFSDLPITVRFAFASGEFGFTLPRKEWMRSVWRHLYWGEMLRDA